MSDVTAPIDPQARKAAIREQARKNRVAQKNKDEVNAGRSVPSSRLYLPTPWPKQ